MNRLRAFVLLVSLVMASSATAATRYGVSFGSTLGVNGSPGKGGASVALSAAVPIEDGDWRFGLSLFAADQGTAFTDLRDRNDGSLLGTVGDVHRWTYGAEWLGTKRVLASRHWDWDGGLGFGWLRQEMDRRGSVNEAVSGATFSVHSVLSRPVANGQRLGLALGWRRAILRTAADPGRSTQWATAGLEWHWQRTPKE